MIFGRRLVQLANQADAVIRIDAQGEAHCSNLSWQVDYFDAGSPDCVLVECLERIKAEWERTHEEERHLGHAAAGMFFCYWLAPDMRTMAQLARDGHAEVLRACASDYIDSGFGELRGPAIEAA